MKGLQALKAHVIEYLLLNGIGMRYPPYLGPDPGSATNRLRLSCPICEIAHRMQTFGHSFSQQLAIEHSVCRARFSSAGDTAVSNIKPRQSLDLKNLKTETAQGSGGRRGWHEVSQEEGSSYRSWVFLL